MRALEHSAVLNTEGKVLVATRHGPHPSLVGCTYISEQAKPVAKPTRVRAAGLLELASHHARHQCAQSVDVVVSLAINIVRAARLRWVGSAVRHNTPSCEHSQHEPARAHRHPPP